MVNGYQMEGKLVETAKVVGCYQSAIYEVQSKEYCHECMFQPESDKCKEYTRRNNRGFLLR